MTLSMIILNFKEEKMYPELIIKFFVEKGLVIFYSIIVAITGAIISRIAKKLIYSFFSSKISNNSVINERKSQTLASVISSVVKYIIYFICICIILSLFGVICNLTYCCG